MKKSVSSKLKSRNWQSSSDKNRSKQRIFILILFVSLLIVIGAGTSILGLALNNDNQSISATSKSKDQSFNVNASEKNDVGGRDFTNEYRFDDTDTTKWELSNEGKFRDTLKECAKNGNLLKCKQFIPPTSSEEKNRLRQRIAILSPPGKTADVFFDVLKKSLLLYYDHDEGLMDSSIELIKTSNVPPYGYGKTHGFTKIIRLVQHPIVGEVLQALNAAASKINSSSINSNSNSDATMIETDGHNYFASQMDLISKDRQFMTNGLRQIVRWHCRLSHVAAHTLLHNMHIHSSSMVDDMKSGLSLAVRVIRTEVGKNIAIHGRDFKLVDKIKRVDDLIQVEVSNQMKQAIDEMPKLSKEEKKQLEEILDANIADYEAVLQDELDTTDNLHKWPCLSFWLLEGKQVEEKDTDGSINVSSVLAKELSPNCGATYNDCFVKRDKCEDEGNGKCAQ
mmetsp:Transcript_128/g.248  ORF Transcript_128/g.248 Transcript_128/m.248 type:complete len:451 (-) Transcript_128:247-1599(-)|eukprot:CAMPEP_0194118368 /NCGR_PEP_ID=MMETSP0150-20130528/35132_1 /TAXON_ID=122233 /ORGANISM="Chaetoceros debilis, Strain MM31A-1" /LENGTH=450 /DNA_ID=CAMNT_0038809707 /DNA_START=55 /DNA_END=1407 /DNA_ORIENTATION=+